MSIVEVENVSKVYGLTRALDNVSLRINSGEFVCLLGSSGSGKSTLLRCVNGLVSPTSGRCLTAGIDMTQASEAQRRLVRRQIGFVFQQFNLIERLSVLQNVLAGRLGQTSALASSLFLFGRNERLLALRNLEKVNLLPKHRQRVSTLSGGEKQRVAIARALTQEPVVILADEPVASLDPRLAGGVLSDLKRLAQEGCMPAIVSLHVVALARRYADRVVGLSHGHVVFDGPVSALTDEEVRKIYGESDEYGPSQGA